MPGRLLTATRRAHPQERREQSRGSPEHEQGSDEGEGGWSNVDQDMHVHAGGVGRGVEEEEGEEEGDWTDWLTCKRPLSSRCRWCSTSASPCSRSRNATFMRPGTRSTLYSSRRRDSTISKCNSPMPEHTGRERSRERVCVFTHSQTHAHTSTQTQTQTHTRTHKHTDTDTDTHRSEAFGLSPHPRAHVHLGPPVECSPAQTQHPACKQSR